MRWAAAMALSVLSGGCIIPTVPYHHPGRGTRGRVERATYAFARADRPPTAREVLLQLGEPDHVGENGRTFVYYWELVVAEAGLPDGPTALIFGAWGLRVRFDEQRRVQAVEPLTRKDLRGQP